MSIRQTYPPTDPCPCSSSQPANTCCLSASGMWKKAPSIISPDSPQTGLANTACFLSFTNNCSEDITREHYISDTVLSEVEHKNTVKITGLPWIGDREFAKVGKRSVSSKVLCRHHNNALSPLDSAVGRLVRTFGTFDRNFNSPNPRPELALFCGEDIERWMLKTICGMAAAKQIARNKQALASPISRQLLEMLLGAREWPRFWGLYVKIPDGRIYHSTSFAFQPRTHPETNEVKAAEFVFHGFQFSLLLGNPKHPEAWGIHRPRTLYFTDGSIEKVIEVCWTQPKHTSFIKFERQGTYDGAPPDWPRWARER